MTWTPKQRQASRIEYARLYKPPVPREFDDKVYIPANVERVAFHTPCLLCGSARECRHRRAA